MPVQRHAIPNSPDDAKHAAAWASGVAKLAGLLISVGSTLALAESAPRGLQPLQPWIAAGVLGGVGMIAGGWRLATHAQQRRGGALPALLAVQISMLLVGLMLIAGFSGPSRLLRRGPEAWSVLLTALLLAGPTLLNVRAVILCGGPHWRRITPVWLSQGFLLARAGIVLAGIGVVLLGPGTIHT